MSLGLDFSPSEAKVDRAFEHLKALETELSTDFQKDGPYRMRFSEVDPQSGWCSVHLIPNPQKPRFGVLVGDFMHNLRSALDYIVTTLADASNADPNIKRGFPMYIKRAEFKGEVINRLGEAVLRGPLEGVTYGLGLIEQLQPYRSQPDPRTDPIFSVFRFSNSDKHREVSELVTLPVGSVDIAFNGIKVDEESGLDITDSTPNREILIKRLRFDPPYAYNLRASSPLMVSLSFSVPPFRSEPTHTLHTTQIAKTCEHTRMIVNAFKLL